MELLFRHLDDTINDLDFLKFLKKCLNQVKNLLLYPNDLNRLLPHSFDQFINKFKKLPINEILPLRINLTNNFYFSLLSSI